MNYFLVLKRKIKKWHLLTITIVLFILFDLILSVNNLQNKTPIIGLKFEGTNLSFMTKDKLNKLVAEKAALNNNHLVLTYGEKTFTIKPSDVGYSANSGYIVNKLLLTGREENLLQKLVIQTKALLGLQNTRLSGTVSRGLLTLTVLEIKDQINHDPTPIHPDFSRDLAKTIEAQPGIRVNTQKLAGLIVKNIDAPPSEPITIPVDTITPKKHDVSELTPIREQTKKLTQSPISISSGGQIFTLTVQELKDLLILVERPDPTNAKKTRLVLRLNDTLLNQKLGVFAAKVETLTHAEFDDHDARVAIYAQFYSGNHQNQVVPTGGSLLFNKVLGDKTVPGSKIAFLTFDDGPNTIYHPLILDILKQYNVPTTFFLVGQNIFSANGVATRTLNEGHLVGNHSFSHSFLPNYSSAFILSELQKTDNVLQSINGNVPVSFFRPPYGGINSVVTKDAHDLGLRIFLWDVDPRDWSEPPVDELVQRVVNATRNGSNVLLHSNHLVTVRALPRIIETLQSEGYTFKRLDAYPKAEELW